MNNGLKTAFTLVELLVVIAIVGILSGLIIVGMSSSVYNASLAKAQVFSASLRDSLLMNIVAEWKLDQVNSPASGQTPDNWSGGYYGTLEGSGGTNNLPQLVTNCIYGSCLSFDGTDDRVRVLNNANFNMTTSITIEAWIKPSRLDVYYQGIVVKGPASYGYHFMLYQDDLQPFARIGGTWTSMNSLSGISLNKWNYIAWTYDGATSKAYVNTTINSTSKTGAISYESDDDLYIGFSKYGVLYYQGLIDNVRIYNSAVPTSEIREHYYADINRLFARGELSRIEYVNRIEEI